MKCKRCDREAAKGHVYCSRDCAPYGRAFDDEDKRTSVVTSGACKCPDDHPTTCVAIRWRVPADSIPANDQCPCRCHDK